MLWIPGGEYSMGSTDPTREVCGGPDTMDDARLVHRVYVDGFWMDATEVTNEQFTRFIAATREIAGDGFDVVFEASGAKAALRQSFDLVRPGGKIVQIGTLGTEDIPLPANQLMVREINFIGSMRYGNVFAEAIRLVEAGRIDLRGLISGVLPIAEVDQAMRLASEKNTGMNPRANHSEARATCQTARLILKIVTGQLLGYRTFTNRRNFHLRLTQHPSDLPASFHLSLVNPGVPAASFIDMHPREVK